MKLHGSYPWTTVSKMCVDSIVKAAGVSKGSFYVHFESKDALTTDLVNEYTSKADLDYKSFLKSLPDNKSVLDILSLLAEEISDFIESSIGLDNMRVLYKAHLTKTINTASAMSYNRESTNYSLTYWKEASETKNLEMIYLLTLWQNI